MKIHEYQAKDLLRDYGLPVPTGYIAFTATEAKQAAANYGSCVLKAQIHSGGRGKAGGVKVAKDPDEAYAIALNMIGMTLVTKQTGPAGKIVHRVLVTEKITAKQEYYLSVITDNENAGLLIVASADGGTEIEETAKDHPDRIVQVSVSIIKGFEKTDGLAVAKAFGFTGALKDELLEILSGMVRLYVERDCSLV